MFRNPPKIITTNKQPLFHFACVTRWAPAVDNHQLTTLFKVGHKCARFNTFPLYSTDICWDNIEFATFNLPFNGYNFDILVAQEILRILSIMGIAINSFIFQLWKILATRINPRLYLWWTNRPFPIGTGIHEQSPLIRPIVVDHPPPLLRWDWKTFEWAHQSRRTMWLWDKVNTHLIIII